MNLAAFALSWSPVLILAVLAVGFKRPALELSRYCKLPIKSLEGGSPPRAHSRLGLHNFKKCMKYVLKEKTNKENASLAVRRPSSMGGRRLIQGSDFEY